MKLFLNTLLEKKPDVNVEYVKDIFEMLKENYDNSRRFYHNWKHIQSCLYEFEIIAYKVPAEYHFPIIIAIYYHDYFYNIDRLDNEEISAKRAKYDLLMLGYPEEEIKRIYDIILLTTHTSLVDDPIGQILLDIDISIFGQKYPQFSEYERNIRREYLNIPDLSYYFMRIKFLKKIIKRGIIFQTEIFRDTYEETAQKNIISLIRDCVEVIKKRQPNSYYHSSYLDDIC